MENVIIIAVLVLIVGLALFYIIRAKKSGKKCIGCHISKCPSKNGECGSDCSCCKRK
ncbi:MAG: FeoB-associated Cys-rich membrane protein [Ruminococcaceae bacterium]|nr:FeoB-associated Cys-rich membrane protein [Oscillospiraceae bacterium]